MAKSQGPKKKTGEQKTVTAIPPLPATLVEEQAAIQHSNTPVGFELAYELAQASPVMKDDRQVRATPLFQPETLPERVGPARYFISATFTFFEAGYQNISVAGVRTMSEEDLNCIEERLEGLFEAQIQEAGKRIRSDWDGLPAKIALTINTINRL